MPQSAQFAAHSMAAVQMMLPVAKVVMLLSVSDEWRQ